MQYTGNYNLRKPDLTDNVNVGDFNLNADTIDQKLKENADSVTTHTAVNATTAARGHVQLNNTLTSTSTSLALTAAQGKSLKDSVDGLSTQMADKANNIDATRLTTTKDVTGAINELFTNVSNGKVEIATAITGKGINASGSDTFSQLSTKIGQIATGKKSAVGAFMSTGGTISVSGLDFTPRYIAVVCPSIFATTIYDGRASTVYTYGGNNRHSFSVNHHVSNGSFAIPAGWSNGSTSATYWIALEQ